MFVCKYESEEELTMEQFMDVNAFTDDMFNRMYRNDNYLRALKSWLPFMHKRGFLDPVAAEKESEE
jgi:hypothetical protein